MVSLHFIGLAKSSSDVLLIHQCFSLVLFGRNMGDSEVVLPQLHPFIHNMRTFFGGFEYIYNIYIYYYIINIYLYMYYIYYIIYYYIKFHIILYYIFFFILCSIYIYVYYIIYFIYNIYIIFKYIYIYISI